MHKWIPIQERKFLKSLEIQVFILASLGSVFRGVMVFLSVGRVFEMAIVIAIVGMPK